MSNTLFRLILGVSTALLICLIPERAMASSSWRSAIVREVRRSLDRSLRCSSPQECAEKKIPRTIVGGLAAVGVVGGVVLYLDQRRRRRRLKEIESELEELEQLRR